MASNERATSPPWPAGRPDRSRPAGRPRWRPRPASLAAVTAVVLTAGGLTGGSGHAQDGSLAPGGRAAASAGVPELPAASDDRNCERSLTPASDDGPAIKALKNRKVKKLVAGVDQNAYRWGYRDPDSQRITGFDIDLVHAIAEEIYGDPDAVVFRTLATNQMIPALQDRTVDVVARTMTIDCARAEKVAFSTAYFEAGQQVLAPKGAEFTGFDISLTGKRVCVARGSIAEGALDDPKHGAKSLDVTKVTVPNALDCLVRLQQGTVDAEVTDNSLAASQAAQDPTVELVGDRFTDEPYGVAMNRGDKDLVRRVNKVLEDYRRGGGHSRWMASYHRWLSDDLKGIKKPPKAKYQH